MLFVPLHRQGFRQVVHLVGIMLVGMGIAMAVPFGTALLLSEWDPALDYALGCSVTLMIGAAFMLGSRNAERMAITLPQALVAVAAGWLAASLAAAIPLALSGSYVTYLDAVFDAMSGLTTSGLTTVTDLDHVSYAHNMWRHLTHVIGGQGIVLAALSLAVGSRAGGISLYLAEGRDERIMPNVKNTSRFIWAAAGAWLLLGSIALASANTWVGMRPVRAVLHGIWMTMAAYDTGGFGPQSQNALYYHSGLVEAVLMVIMLAGVLNFSLLADVLQGDRHELWRNIETRALAVNMALLIVVVAVGLTLAGPLSTPAEVVRKGMFHIVSANSGTGHQTVYAPQWASTFGGAGFIAVALAMAFGGSVSSTAGGIKAMRFGIMAKALLIRIRAAMAPRSAVIRERYHHIVERVVTPDLISASLTVFAMYVITYITGGVIGSLFGYPADVAIFESISATANVGLTAGITGPNMPDALKLLYIVLMWAGRLEFIAAFALVAAIVSGVRRNLVRPL